MCRQKTVSLRGGGGGSVVVLRGLGRAPSVGESVQAVRGRERGGGVAEDEKLSRVCFPWGPVSVKPLPANRGYEENFNLHIMVSARKSCVSFRRPNC